MIDRKLEWERDTRTHDDQMVSSYHPATSLSSRASDTLVTRATRILAASRAIGIFCDQTKGQRSQQQQQQTNEKHEQRRAQEKSLPETCGNQCDRVEMSEIIESNSSCCRRRRDEDRDRDEDATKLSHQTFSHHKRKQTATTNIISPPADRTKTLKLDSSSSSSPSGSDDDHHDESKMMAANKTRSCIRSAHYCHSTRTRLLQVFVCSLIVLLACDTNQLKNQAHAFEDSDSQDPDSAQKFIDHPRDTLALLGQQAELSCSVEGKRGNLSWLKDGVSLGDESIYAGFSARYSLIQTLPNGHNITLGGQSPEVGDQSLLAAGNQTVSLSPQLQAPTFKWSSDSNGNNNISNYTLRISNLALKDEASFRCRLPRLKSAAGKLTVLLQPSQLFISAKGHLAQEQLGSQHSHETFANGIGGGGTNQVDSSDSEIRVLRVRQNSRLKLECRTDLAKPHAELAWLDDQHRRVPKLNPDLPEDNNNNEQLANVGPRLARGPTSFAEETVTLDGADPKLATTSLTWTLQVMQFHHNHTLTCVGKHLAFDQRDSFPELYGRELRRRLRLEVLHEPEVELKVEPRQLTEHQPVKFECLARARPNHLTYKWFLDDQLILNANESELYVPSASRQLQSRRIKCEATNQIGSTSREHQLSVKYSPAYVSHLLPPSLNWQPPTVEEVALSEYQMDAHSASGNSHSSSQPRVVAAPTQKLHHTAHQLQAGQQHHNNQQHQHQQQQQPQQQPQHQTASVLPTLNWPPQSHELMLARQLALGFDEHQEVKLRCDFDANPRPVSVEWFKLSSDYSVMAEISPQAADELIDSGLGQAQFVNQLGADQKLTISGGRHTSGGVSAKSVRAHDKRHIATEELDELGLMANGESDMADGETLDYDRMSQDLLSELDLWQRYAEPQGHSAPSTGSDEMSNGTASMGQQQQQQPIRTVEGITPQHPNHTLAYIHEPLAWSVITSEEHELEEQRQRTRHRLSASKPGAHLPSEWAAQVPSLILHKLPLSANATTALSTKLTRRQATVTSSLITIRAANEDAMGQYVCRAKQQMFSPLSSSSSSSSQGESQLVRTYQMARSIYLIKRQPPRIISARLQEAPIGSRILQVQCLAQINTVIDNQTTISWSKDGKLINASKTRGPPDDYKGKWYLAVEERSPDLLFMRSKLRIYNGDIHDFGLYNCTVQNSLSSDSLLVQFEPTIATDGAILKPFALLIGFTCVSLMILGLCVMARARQQPITKLEHVGASTNNHLTHHDSPPLKSSKVDNSSALDYNSDRKSPRSSDSGHEEGSVSDLPPPPPPSSGLQQQQQQLNLAADQSNAFVYGQHQQQASYLSNGSAASMVSMDSSNHQDENLNLKSKRQQQQQQSINLSRSSKFAAIHESLEHKLHLGPNGVHANSLRHMSTNTNGQSQLTSSLPSDDRQMETGNQVDDPKSLLDRLWSRIQKRSADGLDGRPARPRPTISGPVGSLNRRHQHVGGGRHSSGASLELNINKRGSLSTSLSMLDSPNGVIHNQHQTNRQSVNSNHKSSATNHLVSSKANLIQDSTTASDGTGSSGRSSSTSNNNLATSQLQQQPQVAQLPQQLQQQQGPYSHYAPTTYMQPPSSLWIHQQQQHQQQSIDTNSSDYYANHNAMAGHNVAGVAYPSAADYVTSGVSNISALALAAQQQLYSPTSQLVSPYQTSNWTNGTTDSAAHLEHYQLPMMSTQLDTSCSSFQQQPATCYATICNTTSSPGAIFGAVPVRHNDNDQYESNYGTMLSRSTAYKTLGYQATQYPGNLSNSSTPNSMTTHANNSTNGNDHIISNTHLNPMQQTASGTLNQQNQATVVQSDGSSTSTTMAKNLISSSSAMDNNANGLATHV